MNRIAALDTSTWWGGVALLEQRSAGAEPDLIAELGFHVADSHAAHLLRWLELLLQEAGWPKSSLDVFAAARGPGSFTGIRVGLGTIHGLALATGRPCSAVTTLEALCEAHGPAETERLPLLDAGRGDVYGARYDPCESPALEREPPWLDSVENLLDHVGQDGAVIIPAPGLRLPHAERMHKIRCARAPRSIAAAVGRLALLRAAEPTPLPVEPLYLRPPDAWLKHGQE